MLNKLILCATVISAFGVWNVPMAAGSPPLVLNGINDRGPDLGTHAFELYGNFPFAEAVEPIVVCSGSLVQAEVMAPPLVTQINVNVETMPSSASCSFQVQRLIDNVTSGMLTVVTSGLALEIKGMIDRGITNGRRYVELYGVYPSGGTGLGSFVICAGLYVASRIEYTSGGK
jgi:hypothetical protein